jgi:hypothetical protein
MAAGNYAEACPKLAASQKLDPGAGTLMNLATCYEKNGQIASAWAAFKEVVPAARASGHTDWETAARTRADELQPQLPYLTVVVPKESQVSGLALSRDGRDLEPAEWGTRLPIDPGTHAVRATAPGKKAWSTDVTVAGAAAAVSVTVPQLADDAGAAPTPAASSTANAPPGAEASERSDGSTQRIVGLALGGAGVVALGVGAIFGLGAKSKYDDALKHCNGAHQCDAQGLSLDDDAKSAGTASTIGFVAGAHLLAGGAVLYLTAPSSPPEKPTAGRAPHRRTRVLDVSFNGPGIAGIRMGGEW